jgi:hypothetical protein
MVHIRCEHCSVGFDTPYWQVGMNCHCPHCNTDTRTGLTSIISYKGRHGYDVTFYHFVQLVNGLNEKALILPYLHSLGYEIEQVDPLLFRNEKGQVLQPEEVHIQIQNDPERQRHLYGLFMQLWR